MHVDALPEVTKVLLIALSKIGLPDDFYLSGGTALALHLVHRESDDLDFFTHKDFNIPALQRILTGFGELKNVSIDKGILNCYINNVKLQFLYYPYKLVRPPLLLKKITVSSKEDIASTKIITISDRGSKKDFIDLYFLLDEFSLEEIFNLLKKKYTDVHYNEVHLLKSLLYFTDADLQPMPKMIKKVEWEEVKKILIEKVKEFQRFYFSKDE